MDEGSRIVRGGIRDVWEGEGTWWLGLFARCLGGDDYFWEEQEAEEEEDVCMVEKYEVGGGR